MSLKIRPYLEEDVPAVKRFNKRLADAGVDFQFPETHLSRDFPPQDGRQITQDHYLAMDPEGEVRAGYLLKNETYLFGSERIRVSNYQLPLSEGIINKKWAMAGVQILTDALKRSPNIYCLGMGGTERPLPRMLARFGWDVVTVPFYFKVLNGRAFAREIRAVSAKLKPLLKMGELSGLASLGASVWNLVWTIKDLDPGLSRTEIVESFPLEIDAVSELALRGVSSAALRTSKSVAERFPKSDKRFVRLILRDADGRIDGWALLSYSHLNNHKQFGNMKLGALVDGLVRPGLEKSLIRASERILKDRGADLVICNHSHKTWTSALAASGFLSGPSNFALARSPNFFKLAGDASQTYFNRGDGDGPINL